jgi:hypothetical protein
MPNTRDSSGAVLNLPVRQLQDMSASATPSMANSLFSMMPATPWTTDRLTNLTALATHSVTSTYGLWFELLENQRRLAARFLDAMGVSTKAETLLTRSPNPSPVGSTVDMRGAKRVEQELESAARVDSADVPRSTRRRRTASSKATPAKFPIKGYDKLTVQEITGKLERLRDSRQLRAVLAYEAKNKARKGVAAVGEARLKRLTDS